MNLLTELDAFYTEHRRCSELDGGDRAPLDAHGRQGGVDAHESGRPETEREMIWPAHEKARGSAIRAWVSDFPASRARRIG